MKVRETFEIAEGRERVWEFLNQPEQVAACVPGIETVEGIDDDNLRVELTQNVGPMIATFALKMSITERVENEAITFTAVGRVVRGAAGSVRSTNHVHLQSAGDGLTRVAVDAEIAMGGMIGSVGQKVIAKQAEAVTKDFAGTMERVLSGEPLPTEKAAEGPTAATAGRGGVLAGAESNKGGAGIGLALETPGWPALLAGVAGLTVIAWLLGRSAGIHAAYRHLFEKGYVQ
jgi:carbon monoxide dehydrogenase subunit G